MSIVKAIPSIITLANLICGFLAIVMMDLFWSPLLILLAAIFDLFDGMAARALNAESQLGKELDSLCDMVSFGVAPAVLYWLLVPTENLFLITVPLAIVLCGALRLARFNSSPQSDEFEGLAIPANAMFFAGITLAVYWGHQVTLDLMGSNLWYTLLGLGFAFMMVSKLPMFSFKNVQRDKVWLGVLGLLTGLILAFDWRVAIPSAIILYVMLSLIRSFVDKTS